MKIIIPRITEVSAIPIFRLTDDGERHDETYCLTVKGLMEALLGWPDEMPVMAEWEGLQRPIRTGDNIDLENIEWRTEPQHAKCLVFNVDER